MNVTPPTPSSGSEPPIPSTEGTQPSYDKAPKQNFPAVTKNKDHEKDKKSKPVPAKPPQKKKKEEGLGVFIKEAAQAQQPMAAFGNLGESAGAVAASAGKSEVGGATPVDRIVQVFEQNSFFNAPGISQVRVAEHGNETIIGVSLQNGVEVNINLAPGGKEMNITLHGLSDLSQELADNPEHQAFLRQKLAEQGFVVHQIQTFRGEGVPGGVFAPAAPAAPSAAGAQPGEGQGRGRGEEGEGRGGGGAGGEGRGGGEEGRGGRPR